MLTLNSTENILLLLRNFHNTVKQASPKTNTKIIEIGNGISSNDIIKSKLFFYIIFFEVS
jgi:hypothetical protein